MTAPPSTETRHTATLNAHIAKYLAQRAPDHDGDVVVVFTSPQRDAFVEVLNSHASLTAKVAELEAALRPFAKAARCAEDDEPQSNTLFSSSARHEITLRHLFRARDALDNADGGQGS